MKHNRRGAFLLFVLLGVLLAPIVPAWSVAGGPKKGAKQPLVKEFDLQRSLKLQTLIDVQIRIPKPPPDVDEKGKPREYTASELKQLKGDPKLPGYEGSFADLKLGQMVKVYVAYRKPPKPDSKGANAKTSWVRLGTLVGEVVALDNPAAGKKRKRKKDTQDEERFSADAAAKFVIQVETLAVAVGRFADARPAAGKKHPATLGQDVFATRVVVLKDAPADGN